MISVIIRRISDTRYDYLQYQVSGTSIGPEIYSFVTHSSFTTAEASGELHHRPQRQLVLNGTTCKVIALGYVGRAQANRTGSSDGGFQLLMMSTSYRVLQKFVYVPLLL